jgi:endonuclease G
MSFSLFRCQPGKIDKMIIGMFANAQETATTEHAVTIKRDKAKVNNSQQVSQDLEVPAYSDHDIILKRLAYITSYDKTNKIPKWVAWHLTSDHTSGDQRRLSNFIVDDEVPFPRAELVDYKGSGYDRGHMCPAGDNKWGFEPMKESFYLTNICPQDNNLNCGDWNELEIACRDWANKYGDIYIVAGPILYKGKHKTIGPNKVTVPEAFFKVVLCMNGTPKAIGFIYKNQPCNNPQSSYVNSIDQVERITGFDFFPNLPDEIEEIVESKANLSEW